jgi:peptidoglycan/xylan/chitin deacetylase (PgdA/CDA1 family)
MRQKTATAAAALLLLATAGIVNAQISGAVSPAALPQQPPASDLRDAPVRIAITFDDLPAHGPLPPGESRLEVATKIIATLQAANIPPTYGFVNGVRVEEQPADAAVLQAWRAAGYPLGNHAWSHMNLNQNSLEAFEADVTRNEPLLSQLMKDGGEVQNNAAWHWFRFPYLAEGDTPEKIAAIRTFLAQRGYKSAAVTMSFGDYMWNDPYARCKAKGDEKSVTSLEDSYLAAADDSVTYSRALSHTLYHRDIPYVLLMHIGAFDAEMLPRLLGLYRAKGVQFVTLEDAESDEFYRGQTDLHQAPGPSTLEGVMAERHLPFPAHTTPAPQLDSLCR